MTLTELQAMVDKDMETRQEDVEFMSIQTPLLQSKYLRILNEEYLKLAKLEGEYDVLFKAKWKYYKYDYDIVLDKRDEVLTHINGDDEIVKLKARIALAKQTLQYIEGVIKTLRERSFHVRNYIEWKKFQNGD